MKHLHQLTLTQQCQLIRKIHRNEVTATVKEDGTAVRVGFDYRGEPYVSRANKGGSEIYYGADEISLDKPGVNAALYIAAQLWCRPEKKRRVIGYNPGDAWDCEVVAPGLNVIDYKHAALVILQPLVNEVTGGPCGRLFYSKAMGDPTLIPRWSVDEYTLINLKMEEAQASIRWVGDAELPDVAHIIEFLDEHSTRFGSNEYVLTVNLSRIPTEDREYVAGHREILTRRLKHMVYVLEFSRDSQSIPREGIVIDNNGSLVKIVNPQFVQTNQFYHAVRNCIRRRTFATDFVKAFYTCPKPLIDDVDAMWRKDERTKLETHQLRVMLYIMQDHYIRAQHQKHLRHLWPIFGQTHNTSYPESVHQATLVAFKTAIDSLDGL